MRPAVYSGRVCPRVLLHNYSRVLVRARSIILFQQSGQTALMDQAKELEKPGVSTQAKNAMFNSMNQLTLTKLKSGRADQVLPAIFQVAAAGASVIPGAGPFISMALNILGSFMGPQALQTPAAPAPLTYEQVRNAVHVELQNAKMQELIECVARNIAIKPPVAASAWHRMSGAIPVGCLCNRNVDVAIELISTDTTHMQKLLDNDVNTADLQTFTTSLTLIANDLCGVSYTTLAGSLIKAQKLLTTSIKALPTKLDFDYASMKDHSCDNDKKTYDNHALKQVQGFLADVTRPILALASSYRAALLVLASWMDMVSAVHYKYRDEEVAGVKMAKLFGSFYTQHETRCGIARRWEFLDQLNYTVWPQSSEGGVLPSVYNLNAVLELFESSSKNEPFVVDQKVEALRGYYIYCKSCDAFNRRQRLFATSLSFALGKKRSGCKLGGQAEKMRLQGASDVRCGQHECGDVYVHKDLPTSFPGKYHYMSVYPDMRLSGDHASHWLPKDHEKRNGLLNSGHGDGEDTYYECFLEEQLDQTGAYTEKYDVWLAQMCFQDFQEKDYAERALIEVEPMFWTTIASASG